MIKEYLYKVSLVITTYNRAEQLRVALLSVCSQDAQASLWECIVVNNNSTDDTRDVAQQLINDNPTLNISLVDEPQQGLSHARNRGVNSAQGEVIVFVDDDETFVPTFISSYIEFFNTHPEVSVAGGGCQPCYQSGRPKWMTPLVESPIAFPLDMGVHDRSFPMGRIPGGGNLALRRSIIENNQLFNPELGRRGDQLLGGEEIELLTRLTQQGEKIWWVAGARMMHHIPQSKLQMEYLHQLWLNIGVSKYQRAKITKTKTKLLTSEIAKIAATIVITLFYILKLNPKKAKYIALMRLYITIGVVRNCLRRAG